MTTIKDIICIPPVHDNDLCKFDYILVCEDIISDDT